MIGYSLRFGISNAFSHAFPGKRFGSIRIDFRAMSTSVWELLISDNGVGIQPNRPEEQGGLLIIEALAQQAKAAHIYLHCNCIIPTIIKYSFFSGRRFMSRTILLVEDETLIAMNSAYMLEKHGYEVVIAYNGEKAVEMVDNHPEIALVLMDIDLGKGIDGTEAAEQILYKKDIPIVFLSSHTEPEVVEKTEGITSYGYIVKNSGETVILASIKMAFRLWESEDKFRKAFEYVSVGMVLTSPSGELLRVNEAFASMLGYSPLEISSVNFSKLTHPEDVDMSVAHLKTMIEGKTDRSRFTKRYIRKNGGIVWADIDIMLLRDSDGNPLYFVTHVRDITDRKRMEERLKSSEEKYRSVFTTTMNAILLVDKETGRIIDANPAAEKMYGYTRDELLHLKPWDMSAEPDDTRVMIQKFEGDDFTVNERIHKRRDGTPFSVEICASQFTMGERQIRLGTLHDISERKRIEAELRQSEERARAVIETAEDSIFIKDISGVYTMVNPAMEKLFGCGSQDIIGKSDYELFGKEAGKDVSKADKGVYEGKTLEEFASKPINGTPHTFHTIKVPLHDFEGNIAGLCGIARDITERTQAEELLKKRNARLHKINQYSIELGFLRYDELYPYIVKKLKDIFKTSTAWVTEYEEKTSHMLVKYTSLSDKENSWVVKKLGEKVIGHRAKVNEEQRKMMRNVQVGKPQTLHEVSFGAIPENIATVIEKGLHLGWFMPVVFINKDKITGAAVIAGRPGEEAPDREEILAFAGITGEVIRRKRVEEKLAAKKELLQNITDNMSDLVALTDINSTFKFVSNSYNFLGYDTNYLLEKSVLSFVHPEDFTRIETSLLEWMNSNETWRKEEFRYRCADGSYIWVETVGKKLHGEEGEIKELIFSARDITERKNFELLNEERKHYVEAVLHSTPSAIITLDTNNNIEEWNKSAESLFGYTKEEVVGCNLNRLITGNDVSTQEQTEIFIAARETIRYTKEGTPKNVIVSGTPIIVNSENKGSIRTYTDITVLKQKENEVEKLLQEKKQLLREVHHRIKNHMNTIYAIISLRSRESDIPRVKEILEEIQNKIRLMQNIYQTLYTGEDVGTIHIVSFLKHLINDIQNAYAHRQSIIFDTSIEDIEVSSTQSLSIGIIITELITNSIKYGFEQKDRGTINVSIHKTEINRLYIEVSDDGDGFPAEIVENKSYGFGLTLVNGYVRQFDGEMSIDTANGTTISIYIDLEE